jgi:hypothetical protein
MELQQALILTLVLVELEPVVEVKVLEMESSVHQEEQVGDS